MTLNNEGLFTIDSDWVGISASNVKNDGSISQVFLNGPGELDFNTMLGIKITDNSEVISHSKITMNTMVGGISVEGSARGVFNNEVSIYNDSGVGIAVISDDPNTPASLDFMDKVTINTDFGTSIITQGQNGTVTFYNGLEAYIAHGNIIETYESASVTVSGDTKLTAPDGHGMVGYAFGNSTININSKATILGDFTARDAGTINLDFSDGSEMTGAILLNSGYGPGGFVNVKMTGSIWNMNRSSYMTTLDLTNTLVKFTDPLYSSGFSTFSTLTSDTLVGSGTFQLRTDLVAGQGDKLIINNSSAGNHTLIINNQGAESTDGTEKLTVVETGDGGAKFTLGNAVEIGAFEYGLQRATGNANNWELYSMGKKSSAADAGISALNSTYLINYIGTQTLYQRMGDLKSLQATTTEASSPDGDFWIRGFGGKLNSFSSNKLEGFDMTYTGSQLGIDKRLVMGNGDLYLGVMTGYTQSNPDYKKGSGTSKEYHAGLYGTYIDNSGFYIDAIMKYMYIRNKFNVNDTAGNKVNGMAKNQGYSLSVETGKRFDIRNSGFYVEPQSQITYSYVNGSTNHASNGLKIKLNSYDSLLAGASVAIGYQIKGIKNPVDIYLKSGYVREFAGQTSYKLNNYKENYNFRGGWVDSSLGVKARINDLHHIYGEIGYANGSRFDKQQINLGYRYQF